MPSKGIGSCLAAALLLSLVVVSTATAGCTTRIDSSSMMFGAGLTKNFNSSWVVNEQETQWRQKGDITKINLYYDEQEKCLRGVKPTFGFKAADALRLGSEGTATRNFFTNDLKLNGSEVFVKAEYRYSTKCVEFLRLTTNKQRQLTIGNSQSTSPLLTSAPVTTKGTFLAFFKGFTDQKMGGARTGLLQQLQIYWAQRICPQPSSSPKPVTPSPAVPPPSVPSPSPSTPPIIVTSPPPVIVVPSPSPAIPSPSPIPAKCSPKELMGCKNGKCPSSSCPLSGLGGDVPMLCYGVNSQVFGDIDAIVNPCTNLACKLDVRNCTSQTVLGLVGSVCTGRIVVANPTGKLHPIGSLLVNFPCIEHTGPLMNLAPLASNTNNGMYMPKAWKACDCLAGISAVVQTLENLPTGFNFTIPDITSPETAAALAKLFLPSLPVVDWATTLGQWLAANTMSLPVPQLTISPTALTQLQAILGGNFTLPTLVLPELASALMSIPDSLKDLPVHKIPMTLLNDVSKIVNLTTLATLVVPSDTDPVATLLSSVGLTVQDLTVDGFKDLAMTFISSGKPEAALANLLKSTALANLTIPLVNLTMVDLLAQVTAAAQTGHLPILGLATAKINALKALIPGFTTPAVLLTNVTATLLQSVPQALGIPAFVIPNSMLNTVNLLLTNLTAVPTIIQDITNEVALPSISLADFNITTLISKVETLALGSAVPILGLPSLPTLENLLKVNITGVTSFITNVQQSLSSMLTQGVAGAWSQLLTSLGSAVSSIIPDELESILLPAVANVASSFSSTSSTAGSSSGTYDISTGYLPPAEWAALSTEDQAALLAISNKGGSA